MRTHCLTSFLLILFVIFSGCKPDEPDNLATDYPEEVASLLSLQCATSGCHNAQSAPGAGGLNLESWSDLFEGSRGGSPIIPYSPALSYLLYSVNTDTTLGPTLSPTMPFNEPALTQQEYAILWNWVYDGAPNAKGEVRFPPENNRKKWYVGHQICDEVAVFDSESRQLMRFVDVGTDPTDVEYTFDIKVTPDGKDWFVVFFGLNEYVSRYSTLTDEKIADIPTGSSAWSTLTFSPDGKFAFLCSEFLFRMQVIDLAQNTTIGPVKPLGYELRGPVVHPLQKEIYLAEYQDRGLLVLAYDDQGKLGDTRTVDLIQNSPPAIPGDVWPFEILFLPDGSKYFVSCNHSHEVRVLDGQTDSLLAVIDMPDIPSKMAYSAKTNRVFVSCMEDRTSWPGDRTKLGSISVIDANSYQVAQTLYSGFQPYALVADDSHDVLVVTNRNSDLTGPVPHHVSFCEGRNGYITLIDLQTLTLVPDYKPEILADPSTIAIK